MTAETRSDAKGVAAAGAGGYRGKASARRCCASLWGEDLGLVSRALGVRAAVLPGGREALLAAGEARLAARPSDGNPRPPRRWRAIG